MTIYRGNNQAAKLYVGNDEVQKVYMGTTEVYATTVTPIPPMPPAPLDPIFRGQHDPSDRPGPDGGESSYMTDDGLELAPTGGGSWIYVDAAATGNGSGSSWSNAFTMIAPAVEAAGPGDTVIVAGGHYPEDREFPFRKPAGSAEHPVKIVRRRRGRPVVDGGDAIAESDWSRCVAGEARNNPDATSLWKCTIPEVDLSTMNTYGAALRQGDQLMVPVIRGADYGNDTDEMFFPAQQTRYFTDSSNSDLSVTTASGSYDSRSTRVFTATSESIFSQYEAGDLDHAYVSYMYAPGNNVEPLLITDFDKAQHQIEFFTYTTSRNYNGGFAILNCPKDINAPGQWAFINNGDGTITIYAWPYDEGAMDEFRLSRRSRGWRFQAASHVLVYGLDFAGYGGGRLTLAAADYGSGQNHGEALRIYAVPGSPHRCRHVRLIECKNYHQTNINGWNGGFVMNLTEDGLMKNCTTEEIYNGRGMAAISCLRTHIDECRIHRIGRTGLSGGRSVDCRFSFTDIVDAKSIHGNGCSMYLENQGCVLYGLYIDTKFGYALTYQETGDLYIGFCVVVLSEVQGGGGITDNGTQVGEYPAGTFFTGREVVLFNNTVVPASSVRSQITTVGIQRGLGTGRTHHAFNNVSAGGIGQDQRIRPGVYREFGNNPTYESLHGEVEGNHLTGVHSVQNANNAYFDEDDNAKNTILRDYDEPFVNRRGGDLRPKNGSSIDRVGVNVFARGFLPTNDAVTDFNMSRDHNGDVFDWSNNPPTGAFLK